MDLQKLSRDLIDSGKLIEAGFIGLRLAAIDKDAPELQVREMRMAFFAGAQHLFGTIMTVLDPGTEPTDRDLRRMALIEDELQAFITDFERRIPTKGSA